ncbi:MAG: ribbon-helix-helix protein, CopG family [Atopobiaceae bacterium]|nr:ribbon-helix-helix protein, CopG family [Atopobiaceae bacterium]
MLTEDEMREYVDIAERGDFDPERWQVVSTHEPVYVVVKLLPSELGELDRRADERGMTRSELARELITA